MIEQYQNFAELLETYQSTYQETMTFFDLKGEVLQQSYAPGKWTVKQLLHHIVDAETVMYGRLRWVIASAKPVIWGFDQDAWAAKLDYQNMPLEVNRQIYSGVRPAIVALAERFYEPEYDKPFVHSETGLRTLGEEFDKVAWHNLHHIKQIRMVVNS